MSRRRAVVAAVVVGIVANLVAVARPVRLVDSADVPAAIEASAPVETVATGEGATTLGPEAAEPEPIARPRELDVVGNRLLGLDGAELRLLGVNRSGAEYGCVQRLGIWDGASDAAFVDRMVAWGINSVRVTLNEHCWLGINGVAAAYSGERYRQAIQDFVALLTSRGLVVVLTLMWTAPGTKLAVSQERMANADHSADFWRSAAATFAGEPRIVFDLYGEPHDIDWACWRNGCVLPDGYPVAGMQQLVDAVRSTGARQPLLVSGLRYANDLTGWLANKPADPLNRLIAGLHLYNFNKCVTTACWDREVGSVAKQVPVLTSELGQDGCRGDFVTSFMNWADSHRVGYLAWTFNAWDCSKGPALITSEDGTPTAYGAVVRARLLAQR